MTSPNLQGKYYAEHRISALCDIPLWHFCTMCLLRIETAKILFVILQIMCEYTFSAKEGLFSIIVFLFFAQSYY